MSLSRPAAALCDLFNDRLPPSVGASRLRRLPLPKKPPAEPILVSLETLRPTQVSVGMRAVAVKRRKIEKRLERRSRIERFLEDKPIPSVRGPGGQLFMIDHHHLGLALWQSEIEMAYVHVIEDLSVLPVASFWRRMETDGRVYPFDASGRRVALSRLPRRINALAEDGYRDLAWSVRQAGGFAKTRTPYAEFLWADFFRERVPERLLATNYEMAVERAVKLARLKAASELPGWRRA